MKVSLPLIPEATATIRRVPPALLRRPATKRTHTDSLSEAKQVYASNKGQNNAKDVIEMPSPAKKQAAFAVISPTTSSKEEKTEKSDEDIKFSPQPQVQALFSQHLVQSPDRINPAQLSCFNVTDFDLLDREMLAAKSITSSILAEGFDSEKLSMTAGGSFKNKQETMSFPCAHVVKPGSTRRT